MISLVVSSINDNIIAAVSENVRDRKKENEQNFHGIKTLPQDAY